jgi:SpoIID/LytB domain protein
MDSQNGDGISNFRWERTVSRKELERIIRRETGEHVGTLFDIIPLKRSLSGRLREIEVLASRKNIRIQGGERIQRVLANPSMPSSCFVLSKQIGMDGLPVSFSFNGAGQGLGTGLCQAGAIRMAGMGRTHMDILNHYFDSIYIKKVY